VAAALACADGSSGLLAYPPKATLEDLILTPNRDANGPSRDGGAFDVQGVKHHLPQREPFGPGPQECDERLQLFLQDVPAGLAMLDRDMRYLAVSRRWVEDHDLGDQALVGQSHYALFPRVSDGWKSAIRQALAGEAQQVDEDRFERRNGAIRWLRSVVKPWHTSGGAIGGIVIFTEDITERKAAESALLEREARYRAVIDTAADGFWMLDEQGRILAVNDAYVRRSGYSREELLGMCVADLEAQESPQEVLAHIDKVRDKGSDLFETRHRAKDGEVWPVEVNASCWPAAGARVFAFLRDVTERKRTEAALQALHAEMEQLMRFHVASQTAAAIAHELNQPLSAVSTYAEAALRLLSAGNPQRERLRHALESSATQAQRAGRVVRELVAFLKQGDVDTEPVDINEAVRTAVAQLQADHHNAFHTRLDLAPGLAPVRANRLQVEKVLLNLISNGVDAMNDAGGSPRAITVSVRTSADRGMAQVTVRDSGPGVDESIVHRIFEPFFTTKPKGLGMGLAISRAMIEAQGGQLWVDSEPGSGASFHLTLPFA
jgi:PAS domain S-box-containing protein